MKKVLTVLCFCFGRAKVHKKLYLSSIPVFLLFSFMFVAQLAVSQSKLWMHGNKIIDFNNSSSIQVYNLPTPTVPASQQSLVYGGEIPKLSQYAEYDEDGALLFFICDGKIYDRDGYLMVKQDPDVYFTYPDEILSLQVAKIPGQCDKFFIICKRENYGAISVYLLDLSLQNQFWPSDSNRSGALINFEDVPSGYSMDLDVFLTDPVNRIIDQHLYEFMELPGSFDGNAQYNSQISMSMYDVNADGLKWLYVMQGVGAGVFRIDSNGIFLHQTNSCNRTNGDFPRLLDSAPISFIDGHFHILNGQENDDELRWYGTYGPDFSPETCDSEFLVEQNLNLHTYSAERSGNGQYVYFITDDAPFFRYYDYLDEASGIQDLTGIGNIPNTNAAFIGTTLLLNEYQGVSSIFILKTNGVDVLKNVNNPDLVEYIANAIPGISTTPLIDVSNYNEETNFNSLDGYTTLSYGLVTQCRQYNKNVAEEIAASSCCYFQHDDHAIGNYTVTSTSGANVTWTYGANNNPWDATGPVYFDGDLTFNTGANVTIQGMEFRFGPNSDVVIKKGALVKLTSNSKWTSYECAGLMWQGVNLLGVPTLSQPTTEIPFSNQGVFTISNSTIENALVGVDVGVTTSGGGGVLRGYAALFHNCQNGVIYRAYSKIQNGIWYNSRWIIDSQLKDPSLALGDMVRMSKMKMNIGFNGCSFLNTTDYSIYPLSDRGTGIFATTSRFSLSGGGGSYTGDGDNVHTTFYRLRKGVVANSGGTTSFYVDRMNFQECNIGLAATNVNSETVINNTFHIPNEVLVLGEHPRGLIFTGCTGYDFRENDFYANTLNIESNNVGALIVNSGGGENLSYRNDFVKLSKGQEVQGMNRYDLQGLQLRCNTYSQSHYDQYLAANSQWRHNQGDASALQSLANNRFSVEFSNCISTHDLYVNPTNDAVYQFDYIRPDNEWYTPNCESPFFDEFCPTIGVDEEVVYTEFCPLIPLVESLGSGMILLDEKVSELNNLKEMYQQIVDKNEKWNIEVAIHEAFPMESEMMKQYLNAKAPLSDEILKGVIARSEILDPWHLTQVLLTNCPLTKDVLIQLEEFNVLNDFFMSFIYEAQYSGSMGYRKLLELEIAAKSSELHEAKMAVTTFVNQDSLSTDPTNSMFSIMEVSESVQSKYWLLDYYIEQNMVTEAELVLTELEDLGQKDYVAFKRIQMEVGGDFLQLSPESLTKLTDWSENPNSSAFSCALAVLLDLGVTESFPEPEEPVELRNLTQQQVDINVARPTMSVYPNPVVDIAFVSYPMESDEIGRIEIYDETGKLVLNSKLANNGIFEVNCTVFNSGIYNARVMIDDVFVSETRFVVVR